MVHIVLFPGEEEEAQVVHDGNRIPGRDGAVHARLHPVNQRFMVLPGEEATPDLRIPELLEHHSCQFAGLVQIDAS